MTCEICGSNNGCTPQHFHLAKLESMTPELWREVYWFMRYVYLPFMHSIATRAGHAPRRPYQRKGN